MLGPAHLVHLSRLVLVMAGTADVERESGRRWGPTEALASWFGAQLLAVVWAGLVVGIQPTADGDGATESIWWFLAGGTGLWIAYGIISVWLARRYGGVGILIGRRHSPVAIGVGLVSGVACQLLLVPAVYWLLDGRIDGDPEASARQLISLVSGPAAVAGLVVAVVILAPVTEELIYRGVLLRGLDGPIGRAGSIVVTSAVFAVAHGQVILLPGLFAFAVVLAVLTYLFDGLVSPIVAHMTFNATTVVLLLT